MTLANIMREKRARSMRAAGCITTKRSSALIGSQAILAITKSAGAGRQHDRQRHRLYQPAEY
jgi:hypothetical protein